MTCPCGLFFVVTEFHIIHHTRHSAAGDGFMMYGLNQGKEFGLDF